MSSPPTGKPTNWRAGKHWAGAYAKHLSNTSGKLLMQLTQWTNERIPTSGSAFGGICITRTQLAAGDNWRPAHPLDRQTHRNQITILLATGLLRYAPQYHALRRGTSAPAVYELGDGSMQGTMQERFQVKVLAQAAKGAVSRQRAADPETAARQRFEAQQNLVQTMRAAPSYMYGGVTARERLIASLVDVDVVARRDGTRIAKTRPADESAEANRGWLPGTDAAISLTWTAAERHEVALALESGSSLPVWAQLDAKPRIRLDSPDGPVDVTHHFDDVAEDSVTHEDVSGSHTESPARVAVEVVAPADASAGAEPVAQTDATVAVTPSVEETFEEWLASTTAKRTTLLDTAASEDGSLPGMPVTPPVEKKTTKAAPAKKKRRSNYDPTESEAAVIDPAAAAILAKFKDDALNGGRVHIRILEAMRADQNDRPWTVDNLVAAWTDCREYAGLVKIPSVHELACGLDKVTGRGRGATQNHQLAKEKAVAAGAANRTPTADPGNARRAAAKIERMKREQRERQLAQEASAEARGVVTHLDSRRARAQ